MKTLYYTIISLLTYILIGCSADGLVDLTPKDGFNTEFAFNQVKLVESISFDTASTDTGWYAIKPIQNIKISSPFVPKRTYITTDTFAFEWHDYEPVLDTIQKIANGFDIQNSTPASNYKFMTPLLYSNKKEYLNPI